MIPTTSVEEFEAYGVSVETVLSRENAEAYQVAAYLLRRVVGLSLREVTGLFGVSQSQISHIQRALETGGLSSTGHRLVTECKVKI